MKYKIFGFIFMLLLVVLVVLYFNISYISKKIIFQPQSSVVNINVDSSENDSTNNRYFSDTYISKEDFFVHIREFKVASPKGVIIYFHGNRDDIKKWGPIASKFTIFNYDIVVWDYPGYGKSKGEISEENINEDALLVFDYIQSNNRYKTCILYGRSLGSGVAAYTAYKRPVDKIILETPYYSISQLVENYTYFDFISEKVPYVFPSYFYLSECKIPILIFHGDQDKLIPLESAQSLYNSMSSKQKSFVLIQGGNHNNLAEYQLYWDSLAQFLK